MVACRQFGAAVDTVTADLATVPGVDALVERIANRPVEALLANAGHGLGQGSWIRTSTRFSTSSIPTSQVSSI
jgi:short-subunit dehydrogenase